MDATKLVEEKLSELAQIHDTTGVEAVLRHLFAAERHLEGGRFGGDPDRFTDVVYRTNQVFEGILKEAYEVLASVPSGKKTPAQIEKHFESSAVFNDRLMHYFRNYRQDWRNASTHDHRLDFNEQEAFLAISTVSAFCYVALDQMLKHLAALRATKVPRTSQTRDRRYSPMQIDQLLMERFPAIIASFASPESNTQLSEVTLLGALVGLLSTEYSDAELQIDHIFETPEGAVRPDIVLRAESWTVVVELKKVSNELIVPMASSREAKLVLKGYAEASEANEAMIILVPSDPSRFDRLEFVSVSHEENDVKFSTVYPVNF